MPIEINGQNLPPTTDINEGSRKSAARDGSSVTPDSADQRTAGTDSVNLTDTASMLKKMETTLSTLPVVDQQRVESVRQSILNGSFNVNPDRIAEKMLNFETMLTNG
jgi:negative regulator of flagellin synthesis FlgM